MFRVVGELATDEKDSHFWVEDNIGNDDTEDPRGGVL